MNSVQRAGSIFVFALAVLLSNPLDTIAQDTGVPHVDDQVETQHGRTLIVDWPRAYLDSEKAGGIDPSGVPRDLLQFEVLPFLDSLLVDYSVSAGDGRPDASFRLTWSPGDEGIYEGRLRRFSSFPHDVGIIAIDLSFDVMQQGERVAELVVTSEDFVLRPGPDTYRFQLVDVSWDGFFVDTDADRARAIIKQGMTLANATILRIAFAEYPDGRRRRGLRRRRPLRSTVFVPDVDIWIRIFVRRDPNFVRVPRGTYGPRRNEDGQGRSASGSRPTTREPGDDEETTANASDRKRTGRGSGVRIPKTDDDDDDDRLWPAAIAGVAAVGAVAVVGGTVGYFGNVEKAPIGLSSGYVTQSYGVLLSAAINGAVLGMDDDPENFIGQVTGFYDAFGAAVQPAIGVGVRVTEEETDGLDVRPSVMLGAAARLGHSVAFAGYDVESRGLQIGLAYSFRRH